MASTARGKAAAVIGSIHQRVERHWRVGHSHRCPRHRPVRLMTGGRMDNQAGVTQNAGMRKIADPAAAKRGRWAVPTRAPGLSPRHAKGGPELQSAHGFFDRTGTGRGFFQGHVQVIARVLHRAVSSSGAGQENEQQQQPQAGIDVRQDGDAARLAPPRR